jgi:hypothetical protein
VNQNASERIPATLENSLTVRKCPRHRSADGACFARWAPERALLIIARIASIATMC